MCRASVLSTGNKRTSLKTTLENPDEERPISIILGSHMMSSSDALPDKQKFLLSQLFWVDCVGSF